MENDDIVKMLSKEMFKGSKMLKKHCKKCGFPLFEDKEGNIYCPNCDYNMKTYDKTNSDFKRPEILKDMACEKNNINDGCTDFLDFDKILSYKIVYLLNKLDNETEVCRIVEILTAINLLMDLNKKFSENELFNKSVDKKQ